MTSPYRTAQRSAWHNRKAQEVKALLPASQAELMKALGLSKNSLDAVVGTLRKSETVYTVQAGKKISYEIKEKE